MQLLKWHVKDFGRYLKWLSVQIGKLLILVGISIIGLLIAGLIIWKTLEYTGAEAMKNALDPNVPTLRYIEM